MNKFRNQHVKSIKREAFRIIFVSMLVFPFIIIMLGVRFYVYTSLRNYKENIDKLAAFALAEIGADYVEELIGHTKDAYYSIPEEIRQDPFTDEFRSYILPNLGERYIRARQILVNCRERTMVSNIYIGFYDEEYDRFVMVLDGDIEEYYYIPGQYIQNKLTNNLRLAEIKNIMASSWKLSLARSALTGFSTTDFIPFNGKDGSLIGIIGVDVSLSEYADDLKLYIGLFLPLLLISFLLLFLFISKAIDRKIIIPLHELATAAREYTEMDKVNESEGTSFFENVEVSSVQEFIELKDTMAFMEKDVSDSIQKIRRVSAEKERIAAELDIASQIQRSALPKVFPQSERFDLYADMFPAKEVAGDFYDFFMMDDDHLVMIIADVSGKGIPAALFMMKGKEILSSRASKGGKPSEILAYANNQLENDNENVMFITVWLGILNISTGELTCANAGHEFPFVAGADGVFRMYRDSHGIVCGALPDQQYEDYTITIPKGGGIFLYTDGIAEALNKNEEYFGLERIEKSLNSHSGVSARELTSNIKKDIDEFTSGMAQYDDITMMCLFIK